MMWPASQASKILTLLLICTVIYCVYMDTFLFLRIQNYKIDTYDYTNYNVSQDSTSSKTVLQTYEDVTWVPCTVNPLCHPTVKGLMVDHINHYIYGPLCAILDIAFSISTNMLFLTPNIISLTHVFIALVGAKFLTCQNLALRRLGVILFQIRMFLDDLDGHVARERKHIKGERSEVGSLGFWVDGICDLLGVIAMVAGVTFYFKSNLPRRGYKGTPVSTLPYHQLKEINSTEDIEKDHTTEGISYKTKVSFQRIVQVIGLFTGQMAISSLSWNRYIDEYQELLQNCSQNDVLRRETTFKSGTFFFASGLWRVINPHSYLHLLSLAIFFDKTWTFLKGVHFSGYVVLVIGVGISEYLVGNVRSYVIGD